jgi:hypothetical protein
MNENKKIWKYMDLAKFLSLLTTESLYFSTPFQFQDPFEGELPKSHVDAHSKIHQNHIDQLIEFRDKLIHEFPEKKGMPELLSFDEMLQNIPTRIKEDDLYLKALFGINCWHINEYESDAMWKVYSQSGQGIAIESTIDKLTASLSKKKGLTIDEVRYMDFETDPIDKGHKNYGLFIKRKSFSYENELRAVVLLDTPGEGALVKCNLDELISHIHVSPYLEPYYYNAIKNLVHGKYKTLNKSVIASRLLEKPDYEVNVNVKSI